MSIGFFAAAAVGGLVRYLAEYLLPPVGTTAFPRATLTVNVVGSFVLGVVSDAPPSVQVAVGAGLCGALTTFSGVALQLYRRLQSGSLGAVTAYASMTLGLGLAAAAAGMAISNHVFG